MWKGKTFFCKSQYIHENLTTLLKGLKEERYLTGLNAEDFCRRAAYYLSELNMIHPFREGNGRAIREFMRQLGLKAGYRVDWSLAEPGLILDAMIRSANLTLEPLVQCIRKTIVKIDNKIDS